MNLKCKPVVCKSSFYFSVEKALIFYEIILYSGSKCYSNSFFGFNGNRQASCHCTFEVKFLVYSVFFCYFFSQTTYLILGVDCQLEFGLAAIILKTMFHGLGTGVGCRVPGTCLSVIFVFSILGHIGMQDIHISEYNYFILRVEWCSQYAKDHFLHILRVIR